MTHAPHFPAGMMHVQLSAAVLDDGRFVASASSAHSRIAAIVAGSSIATTVSLSPDTPCCSSAPSDALVETPFRIPSTDTLGFAAAALAASCLACYPVVDSVDELLDLDQGSWEGSLPDSSSLGEDGTPLRGAFIIDSASLTGFQELTAGKTLSILREWRILIAIDLRQPGPLWSAKLAQSYAAADTGSSSDGGAAGPVPTMPAPPSTRRRQRHRWWLQTQSPPIPVLRSPPRRDPMFASWRIPSALGCRFDCVRFCCLLQPRGVRFFLRLPQTSCTDRLVYRIG